MPRMISLWTLLPMLVISIARIGMGLFSGIPGPTMLYLKDNVGASFATLGYMFSGRSLGVLIGAILGGVIKNQTKENFRHLLVLGVGMGLLGIATMVIPWIENFPALVFDSCIGGIMYGYIDAGLQALILQEWGEKASRPHIQIYHFMYSVGAFIAPLIAQPFLVTSDQQKLSEESCTYQDTKFVNATIVETHDITATEPTITSFNPVGWAYNISGMWMIFAAMLMIVLSLSNVKEKVTKVVKKKGFTQEQRKEEPLRDVILVFLPVIAYYFCSVSTEFLFSNYIYAVALCSDLQFSVTNASFMTSLTWLGFVASRFAGIFAAAYLKPKTIIICSIVGTIADSGLMCFFGEHTPWLAWIVSFSHGFTPSLLYSSGVSWLSQITNVTGFYMFIFSIGSALGPLTMMPLGGYIFDLNPFSVMYLVLGISTANAFFYGIAIFAGRKHKRFLKKRSQLEGVDAKEENITLKNANMGTEGMKMEAKTRWKVMA